MEERKVEELIPLRDKLYLTYREIEKLWEAISLPQVYLTRMELSERAIEEIEESFPPNLRFRALLTTRKGIRIWFEDADGEEKREDWEDFLLPYQIPTVALEEILQSRRVLGEAMRKLEVVRDWSGASIKY